MRVFARSNYRVATVAQVAAAAGISEALIYKYFPSKRAIFLEILQHMSARILASWEEEQAQEADAVRALRRMGLGYYTRMITHPDEVRVQFQAVSEVSDAAIAQQLRQDHERYMRALGAVIERGIGQGTIRGDLDVASLAFLFNGAGILMNMMKLLGFDRELTAARVSVLIDHLLDSIRVRPAAAHSAARPRTAKHGRTR